MNCQLILAALSDDVDTSTITTLLTSDIAAAVTTTACIPPSPLSPTAIMFVYIIVANKIETESTLLVLLESKLTQCGYGSNGAQHSLFVNTFYEYFDFQNANYIPYFFSACLVQLKQHLVITQDHVSYALFLIGARSSKKVFSPEVFDKVFQYYTTAAGTNMFSQLVDLNTLLETTQLMNQSAFEFVRSKCLMLIRDYISSTDEEDAGERIATRRAALLRHVAEQELTVVSKLLNVDLQTIFNEFKI